MQTGLAAASSGKENRVNNPKDYDFEFIFMNNLLSQLGLAPQQLKVDAIAAVERAKKINPASSSLIKNKYIPKAYAHAIACTKVPQTQEGPDQDVARAKRPSSKKQVRKEEGKGAAKCEVVGSETCLLQADKIIAGAKRVGIALEVLKNQNSMNDRQTQDQQLPRSHQDGIMEEKKSNCSQAPRLDQRPAVCNIIIHIDSSSNNNLEGVMPQPEESKSVR